VVQPSNNRWCYNSGSLGHLWDCLFWGWNNQMFCFRRSVWSQWLLRRLLSWCFCRLCHRWWFNTLICKCFRGLSCSLLFDSTHVYSPVSNCVCVFSGYALVFLVLGFASGYSGKALMDFYVKKVSFTVTFACQFVVSLWLECVVFQFNRTALIVYALSLYTLAAAISLTIIGIVNVVKDYQHQHWNRFWFQTMCALLPGRSGWSIQTDRILTFVLLLLFFLLIFPVCPFELFRAQPWLGSINTLFQRAHQCRCWFQ
jgi:hypothetical protein